MWLKKYFIYNIIIILLLLLEGEVDLASYLFVYLLVILYSYEIDLFMIMLLYWYKATKYLCDTQSGNYILFGVWLNEYSHILQMFIEKKKY